MAHYNKGANAERELIRILHEHGFAVLRVAGSGVSSLPSPDAVALKNGKILAFECKARKGNYLAIDIPSLNEEINWAKTAGAEFFVAWKVPRGGWLFIKPDAMHSAGKNYMISLDEAKRDSLSLGQLLLF